MKDYIIDLSTGIYRITRDGKVFTQSKRKIPLCTKGRTFSGKFKYILEPEREMTYTINNRGYLTVCFKHTTYMVHKLVAKGYVHNPDPEKKKWVNHIDGNKLNNNYLNLEWCTIKENNDHAKKLGLWTQPKGYKIKYKSFETKKKSLANLKDKTVLTKEQIIIAKLYSIPHNRKGKSIARFAKLFGVSNASLNKAIKGKTFKHINEGSTTISQESITKWLEALDILNKDDDIV